MIKTFIYENNPENIVIYDAAGISRIFIDLEVNGKAQRQATIDGVINNHSINDIAIARKVIKNSKLLVRINPFNPNTKREINEVIEGGADVIMLPMFKHPEEVKNFIEHVNKRVKVSLLFETSEAYHHVDEILKIDGIDEAHIGLNDLHLSMGLEFLYELMVYGQVEFLASKFKKYNIPFGVGGVAKMNEGDLKGEVIIREHARIGSSAVILSRSFKSRVDLKDVKNEVEKLQSVFLSAMDYSKKKLHENKILLDNNVKKIIEKLKTNRSNLNKK
ncbi:HpcH/HpaI aldolase/citrate lyase family protein [Candidatus Pelagibacter sp.]|nr:HpcH/HpaI aldolase/citrate lyase family protein [Candidatus Pelagibacter sp.]